MKIEYALEVNPIVSFQILLGYILENQRLARTFTNLLPRREKKSCNTPIKSPRVSPRSHIKPKNKWQIFTFVIDC